MSGVSVADAKAHLARLLHEVESGEPVHITRRGRAVAVLVSEAEYARLQRSADSKNFWEQIEEMRAEPAFEAIDWSREELAELRAKSIGRGFSWEE